MKRKKYERNRKIIIILSIIYKGNLSDEQRVSYKARETKKKKKGRSIKKKKKVCMYVYTGVGVESFLLTHR